MVSVYQHGYYTLNKFIYYTLNNQIEVLISNYYTYFNEMKAYQDINKEHFINIYDLQAISIKRNLHHKYTPLKITQLQVQITLRIFKVYTTLEILLDRFNLTSANVSNRCLSIEL